MNHQIAANLQNMMNLLPNLNVEELVRSLLVKTNDMHLAMYLGALMRSVLALHALLANQIKYKDLDEVLDRDAGIEDGNRKDKEKEKEKEKEEKEKEKAVGEPEEKGPRA